MADGAPGSGGLNGTAQLRRPADCSGGERRAFAGLVRKGFSPVTEPLVARIRRARWLAFHRAPGGELVGISALKAPAEAYRREVFEAARAGVDPDDYELELGWVFISPAHRGRGLAQGLCRIVLERVPTSGIFATTRPDNRSMIRILRGLDFASVGEPYARGDERLAVFVRS